MIIGAECKLYRNTGTHATPVWNEIPIVRDVTLKVEIGQADGSNRTSQWKLTKPGLLDGSIEFDMIWESGDQDFEALRDAALGRSLIDLACMDGPMATSGSQGLRGPMHLFGLSRDEKLEDVVTTSISARPGSITNPPEWLEVS